jgi:signal transduction histidine kinase
MTAARGKLLSITAKAVIIEDTEFIRIIFFDNGTGIPDEMISKICNPFFSTKPS